MSSCLRWPGHVSAVLSVCSLPSPPFLQLQPATPVLTLQPDRAQGGVVRGGAGQGKAGRGVGLRNRFTTFYLLIPILNVDIIVQVKCTYW